VAAIPDAGGARCAPRGALRALPWGALLRVAVLGGLVIAGWLLGSGIGQAQEDVVPQDLRQQDNIARLVGFPLPDDDSGGLIGAPSTVKSVTSRSTGVLRVVPRLPIRPPQVPVLAPVLTPVSKLADPVADPLADQVAGPSAEKPLGSVPTSPAAPSPFGTATAPCSSGSTGGGGVTGSTQNVTVSDGSSGIDPASTYRLLGAEFSGMPLAAAQRPSTSPD
jgi:hypothetical protein